MWSRIYEIKIELRNLNKPNSGFFSGQNNTPFLSHGLSLLLRNTQFRKKTDFREHFIIKRMCPKTSTLRGFPKVYLERAPFLGKTSGFRSSNLSGPRYMPAPSHVHGAPCVHGSSHVLGSCYEYLPSHMLLPACVPGPS